MTLIATKPHPIYLAGRWVESDDPLVVSNPADAANPAGSTFNATAEQYEEAVTAAVRAFEITRTMPAYERGRILRGISAGITARREELGRLICLEAGKPIRDALVEVDRAALTFRLGAEEAERMVGEVIPLDLLASSKGRVGITRRFAAGPVAAISPFNFPLNLAAHKIAPAIAAGCTVVLKPPSKDPLTMLTVAEIIHEVGVPEGSVSILPMTRELGDRMVADDRFKVLQLHRQPERRLADEGARGQEEGRPRTRRQRRGHRGQDRRSRLGREADPHGRVHVRRAGLHQRPADVHPRRHPGRVHGEVPGRRRRAPPRRSLGPHDRPRPDGRRRGGRSDPALGGRGRGARRPRPRRWQGRRDLLPARPCSRTCR